MHKKWLTGGLVLLLASCGRGPEPDSSGGVTDATFDKEVLQSKTPVLVDFWAPWCGPCLRIAPIVEEVADEFTGKLKFVKVNADDAQAVLARYGIKSIPTLAIFKNGKLHQQKVIVPPDDTKAALTSWMNQVLN